MGVRQRLPIGNGDFRDIRENNLYYVDKTLMIKDFIETQDKVALIARPRRFGKTLNMTMIRDFFDITQDSQDIFKDLAIMDTEYASQINTKPVVYLTFKDAKGTDKEEMFSSLKSEIYREYLKHEKFVRNQPGDNYEKEDFYAMIEALRNPESPHYQFSRSLLMLTGILKNTYGIPPILLIDEYDQPIMSSYEYGYRDKIKTFFPNLYGSSMKDNAALGQALLTGVQRVAKESIFSQFNNPKVYTVMSKQYSPYFGLTVSETKKLLEDYGLKLDGSVQKKYDGYCFGGVSVYNPWSVLNYADNGSLKNYWINTSSNYLVRQLLQKADKRFWDKFDQLAVGKAVTVMLTLETAYIERENNYSLWGLLVNAGYLSILEEIEENVAVVKIPNDEVMAEFQMMIAEMSGLDGLDLKQMFRHLLNGEMDEFLIVYQKIVTDCSSYMDAKENAYHMLFLGMCVTLRGVYEVTSNLETGHGRSDIRLKALNPGHSHIVIELKQGKEKDLECLKEEALQQILDNQYYAGLTGEVICVGLAHDKKRCQMAHETLRL